MAQGDSSSCSNPLLVANIQVQGLLADVASLEFQVFSLRDPDLPVQVFPVSGRQAVDLTDCPTGDRLSKGRYVADFTLPVSAPDKDQLHEIRWFYKVNATDDEISFTEQFDVLRAVTAFPQPLYGFVADLREEGFEMDLVSNSRAQRILFRASRHLERFTGRGFDATFKVLRVDGAAGRSILLDEPIVSIEKVEIIGGDFEPTSSLIDLSDLLVYNRHLSQNLVHPDDRDDPRISLETSIFGRDLAAESSHRRALRWPSGVQNLEVTGVFGYRDFGGPQGVLSEIARRATLMLAIREIPQLSDEDGVDDAKLRHRVKQYKTRVQSITYFGPGETGAVGGFTGDPEIDSLIVMLMRPPSMSAA